MPAQKHTKADPTNRNTSQKRNKRPGEPFEEDRPSQKQRRNAEAPSPQPSEPRYRTRHQVALDSSRTPAAGPSQPPQNKPAQTQPRQPVAGPSQPAAKKKKSQTAKSTERARQPVAVPSQPAIHKIKQSPQSPQSVPAPPVAGLSRPVVQKEMPQRGKSTQGAHQPVAGPSHSQPAGQIKQSPKSPQSLPAPIQRQSEKKPSQIERFRAAAAQPAPSSVRGSVAAAATNNTSASQTQAPAGTAATNNPPTDLQPTRQQSSAEDSRPTFPGQGKRTATTSRRPGTGARNQQSSGAVAVAGPSRRIPSPESRLSRQLPAPTMLSNNSPSGRLSDASRVAEPPHSPDPSSVPRSPSSPDPLSDASRVAVARSPRSTRGRTADHLPRAPAAGHRAVPSNTNRHVPADESRRRPADRYSPAQAVEEQTRSDSMTRARRRAPYNRPAGDSRRSRRVVLETRAHETYERVRDVVGNMFSAFAPSSEVERQARLDTLRRIFDEFTLLRQSSFEA
ncbi:hypothetical protein PCASD_03186 [Puccinia coronata f. sp. avenae]|uniref:Uncharacterized protein n=1 Tax=Puccinia coronata f. sp. avenae TaxID=200324 RepID=A0A2N5VFE3_9BASI|nr:hypothetical protein PCASD_03186 [Puccinia coronata f. sp. avenae]